MSSTSKEFPEEILGRLLQVPAYAVGEVELKSTTNSQLFDCQEPAYVPGVIQALLVFRVITRDRSEVERLTALLRSEDSLGSIKVVNFAQNKLLPWGSWQITVNTLLSRGAESRAIATAMLLR